MDNMTTELSNWIIQEIDTRGWSIRELARRAEVSHATINGVLTEKSRPGPDLCIGLARALREPPERIFRLAGILPPVIIGHEKEQQLLNYFRYLDPDDQERILAITRTLHEQHANYQTREKPK